ncbi:PREDICTED: uncharacterized protein LOC109171161 [Ipomoea nil]|uniref:uncharacterized protein LOC109171161 n=1 Tax=Ipomoea nil TaxID=35883 RepID=UPI0009011E58|nr:PREDICTED: uncharacterized protein LOC109171161 [Ipomoea nil]
MNVDHAQEFDDPWYLHIRENPNWNLVSPPLSEVYYASWNRSMKIALGVKKKYGFVDGSITRPEESDRRFSVWRRCNNIVCSWILKPLSSTIAEGVLYLETASDVWNTLKMRYSQIDSHRIAELQNEIYRCSQGNLSINEYFTKNNGLWMQMNAMRPIPACECVPKCTCSLVSKIQKEKEEDQIIRFLEGLSEEYESIKFAILVMEPIHAIEKVLSTALKMERKIKNSFNQRNNDTVQANVLQNNQDQYEEEQPLVVVSALNSKKKYNIGSGNGNGSGKSMPKCTFCGRLGHTIDKCYKKMVGDVGLTSEQFQKLLSLLQNQNQWNQASISAAVTVSKNVLKPYFKNSTEGRSHYMFFGFFETCHVIHEVSVKLPNGEMMSVSHIGQVRLDMNILLQNVLYIPSFNFNIISATKLIRQSGYEIIMKADSCKLQGPLGIVDGFAKKRNGLYLINNPPVKKKTGTSDEVSRSCNNFSL